MSKELVYRAAKAFLDAKEAPGGVELEVWIERYQRSLAQLRLAVANETRYRERLPDLHNYGSTDRDPDLAGMRVSQ